MRLFSTIRYRMSFDRDHWSDVLRFRRAFRRAWQAALRRGGPWEVFLRGDDHGEPIESRARARRRFKRLAKEAALGDVAICLPANRRGVAIRPVQVRLPITQTDGNSKVDKIWTAVVREFGNEIHSLGICNRRKIAGSSSWTEHSPWPAPDPGSNAWDIGAVFSVLSRVAKFLIANADELEIGMVIFNRQDWTPDGGFSAYHGIDPHTGHIHVQGRPSRNSGTPRASCP